MIRYRINAIVVAAMAALMLNPAANAPAAQDAMCPPSWIQFSGENEGTNGTIFDMLEFDDGGGPALYAGGSFPTAAGTGNLDISRIARWDGAQWSNLDVGMDSNVHALAVYDDGIGGGPALFAAGQFSSAGWLEARHVAKWDGTDWWRLRDGLDGPGGPWVEALEVFDDGRGGGPALYAGGNFTLADGMEINYIAKWACGEDSRTSVRWADWSRLP